MSKGDIAHAAQHQHGVRYAGEAPTPQTLKQRVANIEALIEVNSGKTVAEELAEARAYKARIAAPEAEAPEAV